VPGFCDLELARRLELAHAWRGVEYARAQARLHPDWPVAVQSIAGGFAIYAGGGSPVNRAVGLGMTQPVTMAAWEQLVEFYRQRDAPLRLDLCPLANHSLLELLRHQAAYVEGCLNLLACALPEDVAPLPRPADVEVTRAAPAEAGLWIRTTAQGFEGTATPPQSSLDILAPNFHAANAVPFLARVAGQPAGGGSLLVHDRAGECGGDSTIAAFRGRGVQTALLQARLAAAHELGCDLALLLTEPGSASQRNAERAGFRVMYTRVTLTRA